MIDLAGMLDGARETGPDKWVARCPAHEDRSPSLSIARGGDRWLVHCFAGCYPIDVMAALGLELADLFDDRQYRPRGDRERPRLTARDALAALDHEATVVAVIGHDVLEQRELDDDDWRRLATAVARIGAARALCSPRRGR